MTDCWEILGRLSTDAIFRAALFNAKFNPPYSIGANMRSAIPSVDYDTARALIAQSVKDRPLSLMALGEVLYALTSQRFRTGIEKIASVITLNTSARDSHFFAALGAMIVDIQLRAQLQSATAPTFPEFDSVGFTAVKTADRADLKGLIPVINAPADALCDSTWNPECFLKLNFWGNHTHPVANP